MTDIVSELFRAANDGPRTFTLGAWFDRHRSGVTRLVAPFHGPTTAEVASTFSDGGVGYSDRLRAVASGPGFYRWVGLDTRVPYAVVNDAGHVRWRTVRAKREAEQQASGAFYGADVGEAVRSAVVAARVHDANETEALADLDARSRVTELADLYTEAAELAKTRPGHFADKLPNILGALRDLPGQTYYRTPPAGAAPRTWGPHDVDGLLVDLRQIVKRLKMQPETQGVAGSTTQSLPAPWYQHRGYWRRPWPTGVAEIGAIRGGFVVEIIPGNRRVQHAYIFVGEDGPQEHSEATTFLTIEAAAAAADTAYAALQGAERPSPRARFETVARELAAQKRPAELNLEGVSGFHAIVIRALDELQHDAEATAAARAKGAEKVIDQVMLDAGAQPIWQYGFKRYLETTGVIIPGTYVLGDEVDQDLPGQDQIKKADEFLARTREELEKTPAGRDVVMADRYGHRFKETKVALAAYKKLQFAQEFASRVFRAWRPFMAWTRLKRYQDAARARGWPVADAGPPPRVEPVDWPVDGVKRPRAPKPGDHPSGYYAYAYRFDGPKGHRGHQYHEMTVQLVRNQDEANAVGRRWKTEATAGWGGVILALDRTIPEEVEITRKKFNEAHPKAKVPHNSARIVKPDGEGWTG